MLNAFVTSEAFFLDCKVRLVVFAAEAGGAAANMSSCTVTMAGLLMPAFDFVINDNELNVPANMLSSLLVSARGKGSVFPIFSTGAEVWLSANKSSTTRVWTVFCCRGFAVHSKQPQHGDTLCIRMLHYIPQENSRELSIINAQLVRVHNNDKINITAKLRLLTCYRSYRWQMTMPYLLHPNTTSGLCHICVLYFLFCAMAKM